MTEKSVLLSNYAYREIRDAHRSQVSPLYIEDKDEA